ncbi:MAG: hypothetical protein LCH37_10910, partial [Bacteroidetes bacterium]|nr:hypothetical protein [Bacteroidota bacterium]
MRNKLLHLKIALLAFALFFFSNSKAQLLYQKVLVSDVGTSNSIGNANTSRNIAIAPNGMIGVVYVGSQGVRFAKSTNRGQSFLPSIQLSTATSGEAEINLAANGNIYIVHGNKIYISEDEGNTFTSNTFSATSVPIPHVTSYGDNVYITIGSGTGAAKVFRNFNNGKDTFLSYQIPGTHVFADVFADPATGNVFVPSDNPVVSLHKSTTNADTFTNIPVTPSISVFYSSYSICNGPSGSFLFAAGGNNASNGLKFDLNSGTNSALTYGQNNGNNDRSLASDDLGDVVDGYKSGSNFVYRISQNFGTTFDTTRYFTDSATQHNVAINTFNQDVVTVYRGLDGQIYIDVRQGLLLPRTVVLPTITTYGTLSPFSKCGSGSSAAQSFYIKGVDLTKNLIIKAPFGIQVSGNATSGFDSTLTLIPSSGKVDSVQVFVRMAANASGSITGKLSCTSIGAVTRYIDVSGSVAFSPTIALSSISDIYSNQTTFSIPFIGTTGNPDKYSITTSTPTPMAGFVAVNDATLPSSPISVSVPASSPNTYNFLLTVKNSSTGCSSATYELNLKVNAPPFAAPIVVTGSATSITASSANLSGLVSDSGTASVTERGIVYGLTANPTTADSKVQIGTGLGNYSQIITGLTSATSYHFRAYAINSVGTSYGADSLFTTEAIPVPAIVLTASFDPFTTCSGNASDAQQFKVSGLNLTDNITVTAPTGFEISTSMGSGYAASLILNQTSGTVAETTLYIRISSAASGTPSGNLSISSTGAVTQNTAIAGTLNPSPAQPVISIQPASPICKGAQYLNFGAATAPASGVSYQWSASNANLYAQGSTKQYSLISFPNSGAAVVTLTATQNGCSSSTSVNLQVNAESVHTATVRYFNKNFVCEANNVQKYQWGFDE